MNSCIRYGLASFAFVLASLWATPAQAAKPTNIDDAFAFATPNITDAVRDRCENKGVVGVLYFRVQINDQKPSYKVGPINASLAERLEIALLRGQKESDDKKVNITRDASSIASAARKRIDYTTAEGRAALFDLKYPLFTKSDPVAVDLFVTGLAIIDLEKQEATIKLYSFKSDSKDLEPLKLDGEEVVIKAPIERTLLGEAGQSFVFGEKDLDVIKRGAFDDHVPDNVATTDVQKKYKDGPKEEKKEDLIKLTMFVMSDGKEIPITMEKDPKNPGSIWKTEKPLQKGDEVYFRLESLKKDQRMFVVLLVNGESTLFADHRPPIQAAKWVFEKNSESSVVSGFYIKDDGDNVKPFVVIPDAEADKEMLSNPATGTVSLHVFIESGRRNPPPPKNFPVTRGLSTQKWEENGKSLDSMKAVKDLILKENAAAKTERGLLTGSGKLEKGNKLTEVEKPKDLQEVQQLTIRYHGK